jgi:hypothetical protein
VVVASVSTQPERKELKTLEGGFVILRRMSYGEKLHRQEMATKQKLTLQANARRDDDREMDFMIMQEKVAIWEFANLVVDHNLELEEGVPFVFNRPGDLKKLDPRVGDEINGYIADMNNYEEEDQKGNS